MTIKDFHGLIRLMRLKRAFYFTLDSIIAGSIILTIILLISSFYSKEQSTSRLNYLSSDLALVLDTIKVRDIDNNYVKSLISDGTIKNMDNTILEQIGEFWAKDDMEHANKTASNVIEQWVSNTTGFGIWINDEAIYNRNITMKSSLVSSRKMISGIAKGQASGLTRANPPTLWGPAIAEVRSWE